MGQFTNRHGRKHSRGFRPWLLIPKVLAVAGYAGGLAAALAVWLTSSWASLTPNDPARAQLLASVASIFHWVIIPSAAACVVLGIALTVEHRFRLLRLRWMQAKLLLAGLGLPAMHLWLASSLHALREAASMAEPAAGPSAFTAGLVVALAHAALLVFVGRHKPRFGQSPAAASRRANATAHE